MSRFRLHRPFLTAAAAFAVSTLSSGYACEDLAVLSEDGRYIVLSGDNFAEKDVGNLWWLGTRAIDGVVPGSAYATAALQVKFFDKESGNPVIPLSRGSTGIIVNELGHTLRTASELVVAGADAFQYAWWLDNGRNDRLVTWQPTEIMARVTIVNSRAEEIGHWDISERSVGGLNVGCEDAAGRTIIAGLRTRLVIDDGKISLDQLDGATESSGYGLQTGLSLGCIAILVQVNETRSDELRMARIDLATNRVSSEFTTRRLTRLLLFSEGKRLLEQDVIAEEVSPGAFRHLPTRRARVISTDDGAILKETELPAPGERSHLICRQDSERVALAAAGQLYLIELETLRLIASRQIPFGRYFIL